MLLENMTSEPTLSDKVFCSLRSCWTVTHFRERMGEGDAEGLSFVVATDMTLQTVLAAESLLTAITGTVEWLLPYRASRDRKVRANLHSFIFNSLPR